MRALALPDDPAELPRWLETEFVGLHLRQLAAELAAVHRGSTAPAGSFDDWLAGLRDDVLRRGLTALPPGKVGELLRRPDWLLELQRLVLADGGPYWDGVARSPELEDRVELTRRALDDHSDPPVEVARARHYSWWTRTVLPSAAAALATAAALLVAVYSGGLGAGRGGKAVVVVNPPAPAAKGLPPGRSPDAWGFARFAAAKPDVGRDEYLRQLAVSANDWFKQRPEDAAGVARRLAEFRQGCSEILLAEHKALPPADRAWLKDRCRQWAAALDKHLAAVEAGGDPVAVRAEADDTVVKIASALLGRADTPAG